WDHVLFRDPAWQPRRIGDGLELHLQGRSFLVVGQHGDISHLIAGIRPARSSKSRRGGDDVACLRVYFRAGFEAAGRAVDNGWGQKKSAVAFPVLSDI